MINRILILLAVTFYFSPAVLAVPGAGDVGRGNAAYYKGKYSEALGHYEAAAVKAPNDPRIDYDLGVASYKSGKFMDAVNSFNKALLADNARLHNDAQFNLANALYKAGAEKEEQDIETAVKDVEESVKGYDKVIAADGKYDDAVKNREFVLGELKRLKKKQQEQKSCPRKDNKKPSSDKDQKDQSQQGQSKDQQQQQDNQLKDQGESKDQQQQSAQQQQEKPEDAGKTEEQKKAEEQQKAEEQKKAEDQKKAEEQKKADKPQDQGASAGQASQGHILSQDEANMLLDDFAQNEQPKGMLNFVRDAREERPVSKDW